MKTKVTIIKIFLCSFCIICLGQSIAFAQKQPPIIKPDMWQSYSIKERDSLRARWTDEKVKKVVEALKTWKPLPDFVGILWFPDMSDTNAVKRRISGYDLQGITLENKDLQKVNLSSALLEGAHLNGSNLSNSNLQKTHLENAYLQGATLKSAKLQWAILDSTYLQEANLDEAQLGYASLQWDSLKNASLVGANLWHANLQWANLQWTNLQGAILFHAKMRRTELLGTILNGSNFFGAHFDTTTIWQTNLEDAQNIRDIVWDSYYIYGEILGDTYKDSTRIAAFRNAKIEYRYLKNLYKKENMDEIAQEFNFRENEVYTKLSSLPERVLRIIFLKWTYGYGSKPIWLLRYTLRVISLFWIAFLIQTLILKWVSGIYLGKVNEIADNAGYKKWTRRKRIIFFIKRFISRWESGIYLMKENEIIKTEDQIWTRRKWWAILDCLYFSILTLCTFGYGALQLKELIKYFKLKPLELTPIRWTRVLVAFEAALGIWLFALLATVLFGRG